MPLETTTNEEKLVRLSVLQAAQRVLSLVSGENSLVQALLQARSMRLTGVSLAEVLQQQEQLLEALLGLVSVLSRLLLKDSRLVGSIAE